MKREDSFDSLVADHSPDSKSLVDPSALAGNHRAGEYLRADFIAFLDGAVDIYYIAYLKVRYIFLQALAFNSIQNFCFH